MTDTNYKVGIYLRLSREDSQNKESESISTQRELLLNYIKDNDLEFVDEYVDDGVSGTTFDRVGFNRMIRDCENRKINMIITKDTSRLGRDHIEFGYYVERYFPEHNIRYVAVNDGIDTFNNNASNDLLIFKSAFNDMYVKDISNKLRSSLYVKKKNGLFVGCYAPFGYKKNTLDKHKLEIDLDESIIVKRIFNMFINGYSISKICETLTKNHIKTPSMSKSMKLGQKNTFYGVWSSRTVSSILKNQTYIGNLTQCRQKKINYKSKKRVNNKSDDYVIAEKSVDPIIDKSTFDLAQLMFCSNKNRSTRGNGITNSLLLRGLIYCKECHHTIGFRKVSQITKKYGLVNRIYGNCNYWQKRKRQNVCTPHSINYTNIENLVLNNIKMIINNNLSKSNLKSIISKSNIINNKKEDILYEIDNINKMIEKNNRKLDDCYNDKLDGNITLEIYKKTYNNISAEIDRLKIKKEDYIKKLESFKSENDNYYVEQIDNLYDMNHISRSLISLLVNKIEVDENKKITIYYNFCI